MVLLVALVACAPRVQERGEPDLEPRLSDRVYRTADGASLPVRIWPAEQTEDSPRAVIVALHGFNDYSAAFEMPAPFWADLGISTYAYDQRGFGGAPGRGIWPGGEMMAADARVFIELVRKRHPEAPLYLMGESMGGALALKMAATSLGTGSQIDGLILVAPAVWGWSTLNPLYRGTLWLAAHTLPANKMTGRGLGIMPSDNMEMLRAFSADPLVIKETRTDAVYGLVTLMDDGYHAARGVSLPTLLLYGEQDQLVPRTPVEHVMQRIPAEKRAAIYADGYHMLLRDLQRRTVWQDIASWIIKPGGILPSGEEYVIPDSLTREADAPHGAAGG